MDFNTTMIVALNSFGICQFSKNKKLKIPHSHS